MTVQKGRVTLVGAGPGDPELLTMKAIKAITSAEVLVYDRLVSKPILELAPESATRISVGKAPGRHSVRQEEINGLLVHLAATGKHVVRLKGGDPFIFGRGCEEIETLVSHGIPYAVVPGITAAQGCAAAAGVPLTHRALARSVRYVTGHCRDDEPLELDWSGLADTGTTLVVYMGHATVRQFTANLVAHGRPADTPVLCISQGTTPSERRLYARLGSLPDELAKASLPAPVLYIVGAVVDVGRALAEAGGCRLETQVVSAG